MSDIELAGSYIGKATEINSMLRGLFNKLPKGSTYWQRTGVDAKRLQKAMARSSIGGDHQARGRGRFTGGLPTDKRVLAEKYARNYSQGKDAEDAFKNRPGVRDRRPANRSRPTSDRPGNRPNRNWKSNKRAQHLSDALNGMLEFADRSKPPPLRRHYVTYAPRPIDRAKKAVKRKADAYEDMGKRMRNRGYGTAAASLGASFIPQVRKVSTTRYGTKLPNALRVVAGVAAGSGYIGEGAIRSGRGYRAAAEGKPPGYRGMSPAAYAQAKNYLKQIKGMSPATYAAAQGEPHKRPHR